MGCLRGSMKAKMFRSNSVVVGALFIITMLLGMVDTSLVMPRFQLSPSQLLADPSILLVGVFCVFFMAIGVVGIACSLFPILWEQSKAIAITYISFRVVESLLLIFGAVLYLYIIALGRLHGGGENPTPELPKLLSQLKIETFQLGMTTLGIGSCLACASLFISRAVPHWLSLWGMGGYICLFLSAILDLTGVLGTNQGLGSLLYIPGGIWELVVFPIYLFVKGFRVAKDGREPQVVL